MYRFFKTTGIEFFSYPGGWRYPSIWLFSLDITCPNKCISIEIGWIAITFNRSVCKQLAANVNGKYPDYMSDLYQASNKIKKNFKGKMNL